MLNINSGYGAMQMAGVPFTSGKIFMVADTTDPNYDVLTQLFKVDNEGVVRLHLTFTLALAECEVGKGDVIVVSPTFATALTATELLAAETKGVRIVQSNADKNGIVSVYKPDTAIAAASDKNLFTVTGLVEIVQIIGKVGTVIQTQANNTLLKINPTDGADVDLCSVLDISAAAAKSFMSITGTLANALINTPSGAVASQASSIIVNAGVIELETAADNTGTIKWLCRYRPIEAGARIFVKA